MVGTGNGNINGQSKNNLVLITRNSTGPDDTNNLDYKTSQIHDTDLNLDGKIIELPNVDKTFEEDIDTDVIKQSNLENKSSYPDIEPLSGLERQNYFKLSQTPYIPNYLTYFYGKGSQDINPVVQYAYNSYLDKENNKIDDLVTSEVNLKDETKESLVPVTLEESQEDNNDKTRTDNVSIETKEVKIPNVSEVEESEALKKIPCLDSLLIKPLPMEIPHHLGTKLPQLPQMGVDVDYAEDVISGIQPYNVFSNRLNSVKDIARYCPHTEIISWHLNRLCSQPQCDAQVKAVLKNYYSLLTNALNYRQDLNAVNNVNLNNQLFDINALTQKVLMNRNNNVKVKISFEYELPSLQQNKCDQLCNALEKYANTMNNGLLSVDNDRDAVKAYNYLIPKPDNALYNYPTALLTDNQPPRPVPIRITNNQPNLDFLPNPAYAKLPNSNTLQDLLPLLPNSVGNINQNPLQNELPSLQEPIQLPTSPSTNVLPVPNTENSKYDPLNNIIPALQIPDTSYPENPWNLSPSQPSQQYLPSPYTNPTNTLNYPQPLPINTKATENSYPFSPKSKPLPDSYPESPIYYPLQYLPLTVTEQLEDSNKNPLTNLQPLVRPDESYPDELSPTLPDQNLPNAENLNPLLQNPKYVDSYPSNSLPSPLNFDVLPNSALFPQSPLENPNSNSLQYLPNLPSNPLQLPDNDPNILPLLQTSTEPSNNLQNLLPLPFNPPENQLINSNPLKRLPIQLIPLNSYNNLPNKPTIGYDNSYPEQNLLDQQQNVMQSQNLLQNISQSLQSFTGSKKYQEYVNALNRKYYDLQSYQNLKKNYNMNMDLTKSVDQEGDFSAQNFKKAYSTFAISKNNMILNNQLNGLYNNRPQQNVGQLATENPILSYLAKLSGNLGTNVLSNLNQKQSTNIKLDSSSQTQQNSYNYYKQYLGLSNGLYPQVQTHRYLLNPEIENLSKNNIPTTSLLNGGQNNALLNSHNKFMNQLQTSLYNNFLQGPNYYNTNLNNANADKIAEKYNRQLQHLHRLLAVSNLYKLNSTPNRNSFVELTYKLRHDRPILDPYYYVKYRLPYEKFLSNVRNLLVKVPNLRNSPNHDILMGSDISEASNDLKNVNKNDLLKLVTSNGTLIKANLVEADDTNLDENLKIVRRLNSNIPLHSIFKTDNTTKLSGRMMNPLTDYLRAQQKYLQHLQKRLSRNEYNTDPYRTQAALNYNQNLQQPNYLSNEQPLYNAFVGSTFNKYKAPNTYHPSYNQV
ncbi:unnamed protein product [Danaus chrysippus]|uniref:(African queen) hypothetical protein n=1 Tax=Danaus chrysippus TaxID=151541 RepID=A0A8J2W846_9NEOP|nr:unnamed protein product [Danaus chrysippus]